MPIEPSDEEEKYFHAVEVEARRKLRESLEHNARALEQRSKTAVALATDDHSLAEQIGTLGFGGEAARVFDLLPLVHVAWADGKISRGERAQILKIVTGRGLARDSEGFRIIETLLEERPPAAFMNQSLELLRRLLASKGESSHEIVELCMKVAAATGGLLGFGARINDVEKQLIASISLQLGESANTAVGQQLR